MQKNQKYRVRFFFSNYGNEASLRSHASLLYFFFHEILQKSVRFLCGELVRDATLNRGK